MIDATMDGKPPGTLALIEPKYATDFPRSLTAHDIGLRDLVESATMLGTMPKIYLVTASVAELQPMQTDLSEPLAAAVPKAADFVEELASRILGVSAPETTSRPI
jgi:hydrogenase maturation protease